MTDVKAAQPAGSVRPARALRRMLRRRFGLFAPAARLRRDEGGVAAVEFAFIAPIMLAMLVGIVDVSNAVSVNWRMVQLNKTLADLSSQSASLTPTDFSNIFLASASVMSPYKGKLPTMTISSVVIGSDRKARVCWSEARQDGPPPNLLIAAVGLTPGSIVPLPNLEMAVPNTSYIVTTTKMEYDGYITPNFELNSRTLYFRPRAGNRDTAAEQVVKSGQNPCAPV
jgi:Flp pilus assembly protein TadG